MSSASPRRPSVTLIVPVYGTPDLIGELVEALPAFAALVDSLGWQYAGTIVDDDGSPDPSALAAAVAKAPPGSNVALRRHEPNRGKGFSVRDAALAADSDFTLMSDADLSAPLREFSSLVAALGPRTAMVCGSRAHAGEGRGIGRRILSRAFNLPARLAGAGAVRDTQCGFKLFRMDAMRPIFEALRTERFAFDVELIARARRAGYEVAEAPVEWRGGRRSTLHVMRDGARMLFDIVRIAFMR